MARVGHPLASQPGGAANRPACSGSAASWHSHEGLPPPPSNLGHSDGHGGADGGFEAAAARACCSLNWSPSHQDSISPAPWSLYQAQLVLASPPTRARGSQAARGWGWGVEGSTLLLPKAGSLELWGILHIQPSVMSRGRQKKAYSPAVQHGSRISRAQ